MNLIEFPSLKPGNGRMYFGGLNGVNAFYPGDQFLEQKAIQKEGKIILTQYSRYDGFVDSLHISNAGLSSLKKVVLSHRDKTFSFNFTLADYKHPET